MATATWEGAVLADSDDIVVVEGNKYFPPDALHREYFKPSSQTTICPWKGTASYFDIVVTRRTLPWTDRSLAAGLEVFAMKSVGWEVFVAFHYHDIVALRQNRTFPGCCGHPIPPPYTCLGVTRQYTPYR